MDRYAFNPKEENSVKVFGRGLRISRKNSSIICSIITGMNLEKGKNFLERLSVRKESLGGKYHTNAVKEISKLINLAESNTEFKGLDVTKMIIHASAHKSFTFYRPRSWKNRRTKRKTSNIQIVLYQG